MKPLTEKQSRILDYIVASFEANGSPPTYREISSEFGFSSTQAAADHVGALHRKGYVDMGEGGSRCILVLRRSDGVHVRPALVPVDPEQVAPPRHVVSNGSTIPPLATGAWLRAQMTGWR